jgi:nitrous oxidase accessory protein NosD
MSSIFGSEYLQKSTEVIILDNTFGIKWLQKSTEVIVLSNAFVDNA